MSFNKTFGSMLIIAGTTIGAGMLALPLASARLGFPTAIIIMISMWALMTYTALLMIEVHQHANIDATLNTLALKLLGKKGQAVANIAVFFLLYALCAAYIAGGGSQMSEKCREWLGISLSPQAGAIIFTLIIATIVSIDTRAVDNVNRLLFAAKVIALTVMLGMLFPHIERQHLLELPIQQGMILTALPVMFTSFGFHGSIPSVVRYVGLEVKTLKKVMITGSALPLCTYLLWQLASQGVMSQEALMAGSDLSQFIQSVSEQVHNPMVSHAVSVFADLALATSFLGVSLGLFDFMSDTLKRPNTLAGRSQSGFITFMPPLTFALFYPQGFMMALGYAAIALVILALFLPAAMAYAQRQALTASHYQVCGGTGGLVIVCLAGVVIITSQILQVFNLLPMIN